MLWSARARIGAPSNANQMRIAVALEPRTPVDNRVNRHPRHHDEIPVTRIFRHVDEALALERSLEYEGGQHQAVGDIGNQIECMQSQKHPDDGPVRALVPAHISVVNSIARTSSRTSPMT